MNGFTTTENPAEEADLALQAERLRMALCEGGHAHIETRVDRVARSVEWLGDRTQQNIRAVAKACDVVGIDRRCLPCALLSSGGYDPARVSPDCEGTGRCQVES